MNRQQVLSLTGFTGSLAIGIGIALGLHHHLAWIFAAWMIAAGIALTVPVYVPLLRERRSLRRRRAVMLNMMRELDDMAADGLLDCHNPSHGHHRSAER